MKKWLKENWNKLSIIAGIFLVARNILDFTYRNFSEGGITPYSSEEEIHLVYYYGDVTLTMIAMGASLIAIGCLFNSGNN